jgi:GH35 family endo-1,4-beta-xylanase
MKEFFKINLHSVIDVITNSSTELFIVDKKYGLEFVTNIIKEKFSDFQEYGIAIYLDNPTWGWEFFETEEVIKQLEARGYKIITPEVEMKPQAIMISAEQGCMSKEFKDFIKETFNAESNNEKTI